MTLTLTPRGHGTGWRPQRKDPNDLLLEKSYVRPPGTGGIPASQLPSIWDQGPLGSCTAHGSLRAFLAEATRQGLTLPTLSRLQQYWNTRALEGTTLTDSGAEVRDAIKALAKFGCAPEYEWPYDVTRFAVTPPPRVQADAKQHMAFQYKAVQVGTPYAIRNALCGGYVVVFGFNVPSYFEDGSWDPASGEPLPLPGPNTQYIGGHCVAITYYDFEKALTSGPYWTGRTGSFFTIDNSWGPGWGMAGRFNMHYEWMNPSRGLASDFWVIQAVS